MFVVMFFILINEYYQRYMYNLADKIDSWSWTPTLHCVQFLWFFLRSSSYYTEGCEDEVLYALKSDADWLLGVAVTSFWFEVKYLVTCSFSFEYSKVGLCLL